MVKVCGQLLKIVSCSITISSILPKQASIAVGTPNSGEELQENDMSDGMKIKLGGVTSSTSITYLVESMLSHASQAYAQRERVKWLGHDRFSSSMTSDHSIPST